MAETLSLVVVEVTDVRGYRFTTHDTSIEAAKDWLWRTITKLETSSVGAAQVRIYVVNP